jgi:hypothetical protein
MARDRERRLYVGAPDPSDSPGASALASVKHVTIPSTAADGSVDVAWYADMMGTYSAHELMAWTCAALNQLAQCPSQRTYARSRADHITLQQLSTGSAYELFHSRCCPVHDHQTKDSSMVKRARCASVICMAADGKLLLTCSSQTVVVGQQAARQMRTTQQRRLDSGHALCSFMCQVFACIVSARHTPGLRELAVPRHSSL